VLNTTIFAIGVAALFPNDPPGTVTSLISVS
jgi:hypothetical protein